MKGRIIPAFCIGCFVGGFFVGQLQAIYYERRIANQEAMFWELAGHNRALETSFNRVVGATNQPEWKFERKVWPCP